MSETDPRILGAALTASQKLSAEACLSTILQGAMNLAGGRWGLGYLISDDGHDLQCIAGVGGSLVKRLRTELELLDDGLVRHLAPEGAARLDWAAPLLEGLPGAGGLERELGPALLAPLRGSAGRSGLAVLIEGPGREFADGAAAVLDRLAELIVPAIDNLRTVASLRELVIRDDTADCFNRRYLDQTLEDEAERCRRFGSRFALIFLDMDNLKDVNTHHGHAAGSRVLYEASVRMARSMRSIDRLFRYGGDEFVALLPGTRPQGALEVAERIRRELAASPFEVSPRARVSLTASAGVAAWPEHGSSGRQVVEAADAAMRQVKAAGKNRVAVAVTAASGRGS